MINNDSTAIFSSTVLSFSLMKVLFHLLPLLQKVDLFLLDV